MRSPAIATVLVVGALAIAAGRRSHTDAAAPARLGPDTTGEALWAYLARTRYESWPLWPGKRRLFPGEQPHGALLITYVDSLVLQALAEDAPRMPPGSIIVKDNFAPDSTLQGHTVMYKVRGYDPGHHDWFWAQYAPDGAVLAAGRVKLCWQCHEVAAAYDDLWILRDQKYLGRSGR